MSEYITTPTNEKGANATGDNALDSSHSGHDTPVMEGGTAVPFPNSDSAPSVSAGPIGITESARDHGRLGFQDDYTCREPGCMKVFESGTKLQKHVKVSGHLPYRCKCGYTDLSKEGLDAHVTDAKRKFLRSIVHVQASFEKAHTCAAERCRLVFPNGSKLEEHAKVARHEAFQCACGKGYSKLCSLGRHIDETRDDEQGKYKCPMKALLLRRDEGFFGVDCPMSFKRLGHLEQHIRSKRWFRHGRFFFWGHKRTEKEAKDILLPFRKRKPATSTSAFTSEKTARTNATHDSRTLATLEAHSTILDPSTSDNASKQIAFLAATTSALPSTQKSHTTMPTAGPAQCSTGLPELPGGLRTSPLGLDESQAMTSVSSWQMPEWSRKLDVGAGQATRFSDPYVYGYSFPQNAHGCHVAPPTNAYSNGYATPAGSGAVTGAVNHSMWAAPSGETPVQRFGTQYSPPSMFTSFGTCINQAGASNVSFPVVNPDFLQPAPFNPGHMGFLPPNAPQWPMLGMSGYPSNFHGGIGSSTAAPTAFDVGAWPPQVSGYASESLYGGSTVAPQPHAMPALADEDSLNVFDYLSDDTSFYNS